MTAGLTPRILCNHWTTTHPSHRWRSPTQQGHSLRPTWKTSKTRENVEESGINWLNETTVRPLIECRLGLTALMFRLEVERAKGASPRLLTPKGERTTELPPSIPETRPNYPKVAGRHKARSRPARNQSIEPSRCTRPSIGRRTDAASRTSQVRWWHQ